MQTKFSDDFSVVLRVKAYPCCFTQFTVDRSKLTVNGSVLPDTPNVRYLVALYSIQLRPDLSSVMSADSCMVNLVSMLNNKLVDLVQ